MTTYRYRGTDRIGDRRSGTFTTSAGRLAAKVEKWYAQGWRELAVVTGPGPVPPDQDEEMQVAGIGRRPGERRRSCWYEAAPDTTEQHKTGETIAMNDNQDTQAVTAPAARLLELTRRWLLEAGEHQARARRLGNCAAGRDAAGDAHMLRRCAQDVHDVLAPPDPPGPHWQPGDGLHEHDSLAPHSHEVRPDHQSVRRADA